MTQIPPTVQGARRASNEMVQSRADHLAKELERWISQEGLLPGDLVGTLGSLRDQTGLARSTVSEAVRLLRERGLIDIRPGRNGGLFVAEPSPVVRLRNTLLAVDDDASAVADAIELRDHLEELIATGAARCRTEADIIDLRAHLRSMSEAVEWDAFLRANWRLHLRIAAICPNRTARAVYAATVEALSTASSSRVDRAPGDVDAYRLERLEAHTRLVEAIASGDVSAVDQAIAAHHGRTRRNDAPSSPAPSTNPAET